MITNKTITDQLEAAGVDKEVVELILKLREKGFLLNVDSKEQKGRLVTRMKTSISVNAEYEVPVRVNFEEQ